MVHISSISYCRNITLVTLRNVPCESRIIGDILTNISDNGINVDMISQTAPQGNTISIAFTIATASMGTLLPLINIQKQKYPDLNMEMSAGMTKLNFFDENMVATPGVAAKVFSTLSEGNILVTMITTSTLDISVLIPEHFEDSAISLCEKTFSVTAQEVEF